MARTENDVQPQKTESVHSDAPAPPSSSVFTPIKNKCELEKCFPSIFTAIRLLRCCKDPQEFDSFRSLCDVFLSITRTIIHEETSIPHAVKVLSEFELAKCSIEFIGNLLHSRVTNIDPKVPDKACEDIEISLELVDMTVSSLRHFFELAGRPGAVDKPLPCLPTSPEAQAFPTGDQVIPLAKKPQLIPIQDPISSDDLSSTEAGDLPTDLPSHIDSSEDRRSRKKRAILRFLNKSANSSRLSLFSFKSKSSATLVERVDDGKNHDIQKKFASQESTVIHRQSSMYIPTGFKIQTNDRSGNETGLGFDPQGQLKSGSFTALVGVMTSSEAVLETKFAETFFTFFRIFASPILFVEELAKRYESPLSRFYSSDVQSSYDASEEAKNVRIQVGKTILVWLRDYWKADEDMDIIEQLKLLVTHHLPRDLQASDIEQIKELLDMREAGKGTPRKMTRQESNSKVREVPLVSGFKIPDQLFGEVCVDPMLFDTPAGRDEFARQLTFKASEIFRAVDTEEAVMFWRKNGDKCGDGIAKMGSLKKMFEFERSFTMWVSSTILKFGQPAERIRAISFWLAVSTICLRYRNFSCASCTFSGVAHSSIARMKNTVLLVPLEIKLLFHNLDRFFTGHGNYSHYRHAIDGNPLPTVPLLAPLVRDVIVTRTIPPEAGQARSSQGGVVNLINLCGYRIMMKTIRTLNNCNVPYQFTEISQFQTWLNSELAKYPTDKEEEIYQNMYDKSVKQEPRDSRFSHIQDPWSYIAKGSLLESGFSYEIQEIRPEMPQLTPQMENAKVKWLLKLFTYLPGKL